MNRKQFSDKYAAQIAGDRDGHRLIMAGKMDRDLDECIRGEILIFVDEFSTEMRSCYKKCNRMKGSCPDPFSSRLARAFTDGGELMLAVLRERALSP